jgi:hypothetical protein
VKAIEISKAAFHQPQMSTFHAQAPGTELSDRDGLAVSTRVVNGICVVVSRYRDEIWWLTGSTTNTVRAKTKLDFTAIPAGFRDVTKEMLYRYLHRGRDNGKQPGAATLIRFLGELRFFLLYLEKMGIARLSAVSSFVAFSYAEQCKALLPAALYRRLTAVETAHTLSQSTSDPMSHYPWPGRSPQLIAGSNGSSKGGTKTPLMPDEVFATLFKHAWNVIEGAPALLDVRDAINELEGRERPAEHSYLLGATRARLNEVGWSGDHHQFKKALTNIRTASYIVVASLSGCRNHEIAFVADGGWYSTEDNEGVRYWWMRSRSTKTDAGQTQWMIPEAALAALRLMERWAAPMQACLRAEIDAIWATDKSDPEIAVAQEHLGALFVGSDGKKVRTLGLAKMNEDLKAFARSCRLDWKLSSHQFRRKFASYAARSQFGDLRYLREHFKHWSLDMTLAYALNESQEMALYLEIQDELDDIKQGIAATWFKDHEPLAGGYGHNIVNWRSKGEPVTLFKDHKQMISSIARSTSIRSNGHAWCTADDNQCVGNDLERTRCGDGCNNAVIGQQHAAMYQGLYGQLKELENCEDIGDGGRARVRRDLERCASVLGSLGADLMGVP